MRFPYLVLPTKRAVYSLGGISARPRLVIPVQISGPLGSLVLDACLDTGTDDTLFPKQVARALGIGVTQAPDEGEALPIGGSPLRYPYGRVTLRVADGVEACELEAIVGFIDVALPWPLLGLAGFLQFFDATLKGDQKELLLTPNNSFPGRSSRRAGSP